MTSALPVAVWSTPGPKGMLMRKNQKITPKNHKNLNKVNSLHAQALTENHRFAAVAADRGRGSGGSYGAKSGHLSTWVTSAITLCTRPDSLSAPMCRSRTGCPSWFSHPGAAGGAYRFSAALPRPERAYKHITVSNRSRSN